MAVAAVATCSLLGLGACGSPTPLTRSQTAGAPTRSPTTARGRLLVPSQVSPAYEMLTPGTVVPSQDLFQVTQSQGQEVFVSPQKGYGLAFVQSQTYPVTTADGGISWRVDGPIFYVAAADADAYVDQISAPSPQTVLVWGPDSANTVDVTTDGGDRWRSADLGPGVLGMGETITGKLWAVVADPSARFFLSTNGGRTWSSRDTLG
jgi:hypothetical protein